MKNIFENFLDSGKNRAIELEAKEKKSEIFESVGFELLTEAQQEQLRQQKQQAILEEYIRDLRTCKRTGNICVFISHRSADKALAEELGDYINGAGLDVYLDKFDAELQQETQRKHAASVVWHIQKAISVSTHVLVLLSEATRESWWVPYEIGYAKRCGRKIASLNDIVPVVHRNYGAHGSFSQHIELPEYILTEEMLNGRKGNKGFEAYVSRLQSENGQCRVFLEERGF